MFFIYPFFVVAIKTNDEEKFTVKYSAYAYFCYGNTGA